MKEIKDYTDTELKALAFDNLSQMEQCQVNIKVINEELKKRKEITPETKKK